MVKRQGQFLKKFLYRNLSFESYLSALSKMYFLSFNLGILKGNKLYDYPYFLENVIKKGDVCIDIGANLGYIAKRLSSLVGKNGRVLAVEPVDSVLNVLRKNLKSRSNVEILPYALGAENKTIKLGNNSLSSKGFIASGSHFVLEDTAQATSEFDAEMRKASELFINLEKVDFIKIDIEGYETVVVPEMKAVIEKFEPILLIEARRESRLEMLAFFNALNYESLVLHDGKLHPAKEDEYWDILFVPPSKHHIISAFIV